MAPKYSHVKKRPAPRKKQFNKDKDKDDSSLVPNPQVDRNLTQAFSAVSKLERTIARILLLRYEQDIARLFSTRLYTVSLVHLPTLVMRCVSLGGPGWGAHNADSEEIKDFFRAAISMDMRQAGERVATKSVLWSYTALRHFALSNNVPVCQTRGLHSLRLLPHYDALKSHLDALEALPPPQFSKPPHLGPLIEGEAALEEACEIKFGLRNPNGKGKNKGKHINGKGKGKEKENHNDNDLGTKSKPKSPDKDRDRDRGKGYMDPSTPYDPDWRPKVLLSYEKLVQTLWRVAREFDVRGYGLMLREKLTYKWCECGCSTDHLGEVCERTVREEEEWMFRESLGLNDGHGHTHTHGHGHVHGHGHGPHSGCGPPRGFKAKGKQREWDGRGSGVFGWDTQEEEDIWEVELDFGGVGMGSPVPAFEHRDGEESDDEHHHGHRHRSRRSRRRDTKTPKQSSPSPPPSKETLSPDLNPLSDLPLSEMSISEIMEFRFLRAEKEKEAGNAAFRRGEYLKAVEFYEKAYGIEKEMPTYMLNEGMAWLRLAEWAKAEEACSKALSQHKSPKGYFRRAKARKMLGRTEDALRDLRAVLKLQPTNIEARNELLSLYPSSTPATPTTKATPQVSASPPERDLNQNENAAGSSSSSTGAGSSSAMSSGSYSGAGSSSALGSSSSSSSAFSSSSSTSIASSHLNGSSNPKSTSSTPTPTSTRSQSQSQTPIPTIPGLTLKPSKPLPFPRTLMDDRKIKIVQFPAGFALDTQMLDLVDGSGSSSGSASGAAGSVLGGMMMMGGWALGGIGGIGGVGGMSSLTPTNYYYANGYGESDGPGGGGGGGGKGVNGNGKEHGPHGYGCTCGRGRGAKDGDSGEKREKTREEKERADRAWKRQKELEKLRATPGVVYPGWERYVVKRVD